MKKLIISCFLLFSSILLAQLTASQKSKLALDLAHRVNKLRIEKGRIPLENDKSLANAAEFHSSYMAKFQRLTHNQHIEAFRTPRNRVEEFSDSFELVGENILYSKPIRLPINEVQLKKIAFDMFRSWKGSPGHYDNMISPDYCLGDFGFAYNSKTKRIYATQVFGKKGHVVPNQLSTNAFGIVYGENECSDFISQYSNIVLNMGNKIHIEGNKILFKYHNKHTILNILESKYDGFAIDLIEKNQITCDAVKLDKSLIYDGTMLKPVYRDDIFTNNIAKSNYRLVVSLGEVPQHLQGKDLQANLIFIKNKKKCGYSIPLRIPNDSYELLPIEPSVYKPSISLITAGTKGFREVFFEFKSGKILAEKVPKLDYNLKDVYAVDIKSFTSIEGSLSANNRLHNGRAEYIKKIVEKGLDKKTAITIEAKENWELCEYQLELFGLRDLLDKERKEIRKYVNSNRDEKWNKALYEQRRSKAIVYIKGSWNDTDPEHLNYNLLTAILTNNTVLMNKVLAELYLSNQYSYLLAEDFILSKLLNKSELVENISALLLKNLEYYSINSVVYFVRNWLDKPEELTEGAQKNLLNLYTITTRKLLRLWDLESSVLAQIMSPSRVYLLLDNYKGKTKVHPLLLNYHIATIRYYGQINDDSKIGASFTFITNYFRNKVSKIEDEIKLGLFFNSWSMYHYTSEMLYKRINNSDFNEEAAFLLGKTLTNFEQASLNKSIEVHKKAIHFNQKRWCNLVKGNSQLLRNTGIKDLFCQQCN